MKQDELIKAATCLGCRRKLGAIRNILFYRVGVTSYILNTEGLRRAVGLETMIGTAARYIGPDEDLAKPFVRQEFTLCQDCYISRSGLLGLIGEPSNPELIKETMM